MTDHEFQMLVERLGSVAGEIQAALEQGAVTASERQQAQIMGIRRGLKRGVMQQQGVPDTAARGEIVRVIAQIVPRVARELPGWRVGCRRNDRGEQLLVLTRRRPLGPLAGCALFAASIDELEGVARLLEQQLTGRACDPPSKAPSAGLAA